MPTTVLLQDQDINNIKKIRDMVYETTPDNKMITTTAAVRLAIDEYVNFVKNKAIFDWISTFNNMVVKSTGSSYHVSRIEDLLNIIMGDPDELIEIDIGKVEFVRRKVETYE